MPLPTLKGKKQLQRISLPMPMHRQLGEEQPAETTMGEQATPKLFCIHPTNRPQPGGALQRAAYQQLQQSIRKTQNNFELWKCK